MVPRYSQLVECAQEPIEGGLEGGNWWQDANTEQEADHNSQNTPKCSTKSWTRKTKTSDGTGKWFKITSDQTKLAGIFRKVQKAERGSTAAYQRYAANPKYSNKPEIGSSDQFRDSKHQFKLLNQTK